MALLLLLETATTILMSGLGGCASFFKMEMPPLAERKRAPGLGTRNLMELRSTVERTKVTSVRGTGRLFWTSIFGRHRRQQLGLEWRECEGSIGAIAWEESHDVVYITRMRHPLQS
jgi:hypothetical protein